MGTGCRMRAGVLFCVVCGGVTSVALAGKPAPRPPTAQGSFTDHVTLDDGVLDVLLEDLRASGQPYQQYPQLRGLGRLPYRSQRRIRNRS